SRYARTKNAMSGCFLTKAPINPPKQTGSRKLCYGRLRDLLTLYQKRDAYRTPQQGQQQILGGTEDRVCSITEWESHDQQHTAPPGQQLGPENDHTEKYRANEQYQCAADPNDLERSLSLHHVDRGDGGNDRVAGKGQHRPDSTQAPVPRPSAVHRVNAQ